jgi:transglutaminase-like putative cysteine protease
MPRGGYSLVFFLYPKEKTDKLRPAESLPADALPSPPVNKRHFYFALARQVVFAIRGPGTPRYLQAPR